MAMSEPGFFGRRRSAPGVGRCIILTPSTLEWRYHDQELLASDRDLTRLITPSSAPSYRQASGGSGLRIVAVLGPWWLPSEMRSYCLLRDIRDQWRVGEDHRGKLMA